MNTKMKFLAGCLAGVAIGGVCVCFAPGNAAADAMEHYRQAHEAFERKDAARAISNLGIVLASHSLSVQERCAALYNRSLLYEQEGQVGLAIADLDASLAVTAEDVQALNARGALKTAKGAYDDAIKDFDAAAALAPRFSKAHYNKGIAHFRKADYELAVQDYDKAIALDAQYGVAYSNRGAALNALRRFDQALADFEQAIRLNPADALAYYGRGNAYEGKEDYAKAVADFAKAAELDPQSAYACNRLGWLYAACHAPRYRDGDKALAYALKAVQLSRNAVTVDTLAAAQARQGKLKEAAVTQKEALALLKAGPAAIPALLSQYQKRLALYESGSAYAD